MSGIFVAQCIAFASCTILLLLFYVYWNDRRLTQIPPRPLYFPPKRHTASTVDVYAEARGGGVDLIGLNIREVGQSHFERLSWTAFQKKIKHEVSSKVSSKTEYCFIIVNSFSCVFQKNWPTLRRLCSVQLTSIDTNLRRVQPAAKKSEVEGCVLNFFYDTDSDELDLRGIEVTLK